MGNTKPRVRNTKATKPPAETPVKKGTVAAGEAAAPAAGRVDAAVGAVPPADEVQARAAARQKVAEKQAALEAETQRQQTGATDDAPLESDNPAPTGDAKPVVVADKDNKGKPRASKPKKTAEEKAADAAKKALAKQKAAEKKRKKEERQTAKRAGDAVAGNLDATPGAVRTGDTTDGTAETVETQRREAPPQKERGTGQLNLIPRLVGYLAKNTVPAAQQALRLRNDAAIVGGGIYGLGKAGGIKGIGDFLYGGFGGSGEDKKDSPTPRKAADADPAKPQSFRDRMLQKQETNRARIAPDRSEILLQKLMRG